MPPEARAEDGRGGEADRSAQPGGLPRLWQLLLPIVAPTTIIAALMIYLGSVWVNARLKLYGLTPDVLDLSPQDYMLQSADATFRPLLWPLLAIVILGPAYVLFISGIAAPATAARRRGGGPTVVGLLACLLGFLGTVGAVRYNVSFPVVPLGILVGVLLLGLARRLRALTGHGVSRLQAEAPLLYTFWSVALVCVLALTLLWGVAYYVRGEAFASAQAGLADPYDLPRVAVYAPERLHIEGEGVTEIALPQARGEAARYRYRYEGLRLLIHANKRFFLIPACSGRNGLPRAIALPDHDSIRVDLALPHGRPDAACP
jgi:hypothetical protein